MKLYQSVGPNPAVVKMFIAEKGMDVPREEVDIRGGENRQDDFLKINPRGQSPALVTDGGQLVTEITAICEYLEEVQPSPALIGTTPEERGETRMWTRRIDLGICEPMANGFRFSEGIKMLSGFIKQQTNPVSKIFKSTFTTLVTTASSAAEMTSLSPNN